MKCYYYLRNDQDLLADGKSQNERRFRKSLCNMPCSRRKFFGKKIFWLLRLKKLEKLKRERICISCGRWFSKIIRKRLRIPRTHSETGIHRKERESQRRNREEFQPEKKDDEGINKDFWAHAEARKEFHLSSWYWTEKFKQRAERRIFPYFTSFGLLSETPPRRNFRCGRRNGKKPKHLRRNKCNCIDIAGKYEILHHITTLRTNPFLRKDLKKAFHQIFSEGESKHTLSLGTAYLWDKILQFNLKIREYEILSSENLGRKKYELRMLFCSANFEESRVTCGSEDSGDLSLRHACLGKPRSTNKKTFHFKQYWFQMQRRQWKRNESRS